jgi:hypothetical protein
MCFQSVSKTLGTVFETNLKHLWNGQFSVFIIRKPTQNRSFVSFIVYKSVKLWRTSLNCGTKWDYSVSNLCSARYPSKKYINSEPPSTGVFLTDWWQGKWDPLPPLQHSLYSAYSFKRHFIHVSCGERSRRVVLTQWCPTGAFVSPRFSCACFILVSNILTVRTAFISDLPVP